LSLLRTINTRLWIIVKAWGRSDKKKNVFPPDPTELGFQAGELITLIPLEDDDPEASPLVITKSLPLCGFAFSFS
jgi:hypothetical protein